MDLSPSSSSPSSAPVPKPCQWSGARLGAAACHLAGRVLWTVATCAFAAVGLVVGAVTGSMVGLATDSGMLRSAGIWAISGAIFSIEVAESSSDLWHSADSGVWSLYVVDIISGLLSGRLVREKVGPAVQRAVRSQISAISSPFEETSDQFETSSVMGLPEDAVCRLPEMVITEGDSAVDAALRCSVCLQDFWVGEPARRLLGCSHLFHVPCIDCWLVRHDSCPLCRRDI